MLTLGIHDGHTATACVIEDGKVLACVSEERLVREKEWSGFPREAIGCCLKISGKTPQMFDAVGFCSLLPQTGHSAYRNPHWTKRTFGHVARLLPRRLLQREGNIALVQRIGQLLTRNRKRRLATEIGNLGFDCPHDFFEHHLLHASTAYYTSWNKSDRTLVITLDGSGDAVSGTVNIGQAGTLERISAIFNYNSICEFYTKVTEYLGLKAMSHEYKVMGMSPYAEQTYRAELVSVFERFFRVPSDRPLQIVNESGCWKWQFLALLHRILFRKRFDSIAGAVQDVYESVVLRWVKNAIRESGIRDVVLSGGGFMNVKLNAKILDLPEVRSLFVFPSCGDESNAIGAAILAALDQGFDYRRIEAIDQVFWGPDYSREEIQSAIDTLLPSVGFSVETSEDIDAFVARKIADGKIIGRMVGRMEWGARALGNRSIVADPRSSNVIHRINKAIKMRDFWMPFAPAILREDAERYLAVPEGYRCPFMVMAFSSHGNAAGEISAGLHPFDNTARAQLVEEKSNPRFHHLIKCFKSYSGVSAVLNTSFNLHGESIVCDPADAIHTLLHSDLDGVQIDDFYIERLRD